MINDDYESDSRVGSIHNNWISRLAAAASRAVDGIQKIFFALAIIVILAFAVFYIWKSWRPVMTIEPITAPNALAVQGFTPNVTQKIFRDDLFAIFDSASSVMPTEMHESLEGDEGDFHFDIPGTGMSLQDIVRATKALLRVDGQITAEIVQDDKKLSLSGRIVRPGGVSHSFQVESADGNVRQLLMAGAMEVMKSFSPYVRASSMLEEAMKDCSSHVACDFSEVATGYERILDPQWAIPQDRERYAKWAHLGLSKVAEVNLDYLTEIEHARQALRLDPDFGWARYNWGIALENIGCYQGALEQFRKAVFVRDKVPENHNALGRGFLRIARSVDAAESTTRYIRPASRDEKNNPAVQAESEFRSAIVADPQYTEAYIHLGEALALQQKYAQALTVLQRATGMRGEYAARAYGEVAVVESKMGNQEKVGQAINDGNRSDRNHAQCKGGVEASSLAADHCTNEAAALVAQPTDWHVPKWPADSFEEQDCSRYSRDDWP